MIASILYAGIVSIRTSQFHCEGARKVGLPAPRLEAENWVIPSHF
jgi:hypothetical protein